MYFLLKNEDILASYVIVYQRVYRVHLEVPSMPVPVSVLAPPDAPVPHMAPEMQSPC